jgi:hypothetical protein
VTQAGEILGTGRVRHREEIDEQAVATADRNPQRPGARAVGLPAGNSDVGFALQVKND